MKLSRDVNDVSKTNKNFLQCWSKLNLSFYQWCEVTVQYVFKLLMLLEHIGDTALFLTSLNKKKHLSVKCKELL